MWRAPGETKPLVSLNAVGTTMRYLSVVASTQSASWLTSMAVMGRPVFRPGTSVLALVKSNLSIGVLEP